MTTLITFGLAALFLIGILLIYFAPTFTAITNCKPWDTVVMIFLLNLMLGWTIIGYIVCFGAAMGKEKDYAWMPKCPTHGYTFSDFVDDGHGNKGCPECGWPTAFIRKRGRPPLPPRSVFQSSKWEECELRDEG